VEYRSSAHVVRALAAGEEAFFSTLEKAPDFDAGAFEAFLTYHNLLDWVAPAFANERAASLLPEAFRRSVADHRAARLVRNEVLLRESVQIRDAFAAAGIEPLFLKGLYFGQRFYGDVNRRYQSDVDVFVRSARLEEALTALGQIGFDVETTGFGVTVRQRLGKIRGRRPETAEHAVTVRRGPTKVDLHWCLSSRSLRRIAEGPLWAARRRFVLEGHEFETLSDGDTLMFLLVSICGDLRRGACRAKHFLDLQLMLNALEPALDWDRFCAQRRREGVLRACVNVLDVFLTVWDRAGELPATARAVAGRQRLLEVYSDEEAFALVERPRGNAENRTWFSRVYPRSELRYWARRLTRDLPHTLARLARWRTSSGVAAGSRQTG